MVTLMPDFKSRVRFIDASPVQCRFFSPDESGMSGFVCGDPTLKSSAFCGCHHRVVFLPLRPNGSLKSARFDRSVRDADMDDFEFDLTELVL
jgi:hypothetical protein